MSLHKLRKGFFPEHEEAGCHYCESFSASQMTSYAEQYSQKLAINADNKIEQLRAALGAIVELYNTDEGCTSLPEYINACKALEDTK